MTADVMYAGVYFQRRYQVDAACVSPGLILRNSATSLPFDFAQDERQQGTLLLFVDIICPANNIHDTICATSAEGFA
jgi:hypothetical protein